MFHLESRVTKCVKCCWDQHASIIELIKSSRALRVSAYSSLRFLAEFTTETEKWNHINFSHKRYSQALPPADTQAGEAQKDFEGCYAVITYSKTDIIETIFLSFSPPFAIKKSDESHTIFARNVIINVWYGKLSPHAKKGLTCMSFLVNKRLFAVRLESR